MRLNKRIAATILATVMGAGCMATAANAATWGPTSSYYNGNKVVTGQGEFYNAVGTATSVVTTTDNKDDGNNVHSTTSFYAYMFGIGNTTLDWRAVGKKSTEAFANKSLTQTVKRAYSPSEGNQMRGSIISCAQMGWPVPDSCTSPVVITVSF